MSQSVFLIGMPACGKTHWGRLWSDLYQWKFIDLDERIVQEEGASVAELFERYGEPGFREIERRVLLGVIEKFPVKTIIACGGGTPIFFDNLYRMKETGMVVYLEAKLSLLEGRVAQAPLQRPLLHGPDRTGALQRLLQARESIYTQAHITIASEMVSLTTFEQILTACTNRP